MNRFLYLLPLLFFLACDDEEPGGGPNTVNFDRAAMLESWADGAIIPAYTTLEASSETLATAASDFNANPDATSLESLRQAYREAYVDYQAAAPFIIGKAEEIRYLEQLSIYPSDVAQIEENATTGTHNLDLPSAVDEQGFPALDYLLYGISEEELLNGSNAAAYRSYLIVLATRIHSLTGEVLTDWTDNGFREQFISNSGNSATASVDRMVNDFIFYYEKHLRAGKVGIPAGVFSNAPLPDNAEAPYSGDFAKTLFTASFTNVRNFFNGRFGGGIGLIDYLDALEVERDGELLSGVINDQFTQIEQQLANVGDDFRNQVIDDNTEMLRLYDELQKAVILLKVDMLQALNINVDFVDADGD